jgi:hypothetical protein
MSRSEDDLRGGFRLEIVVNQQGENRRLTYCGYDWRLIPAFCDISKR